MKRLQKNGFKAILPGIESWFDLGNKSKTRRTGMDKVKLVWRQLDTLPESDVSENQIWSVIRAISGTGGLLDSRAEAGQVDGAAMPAWAISAFRSCSRRESSPATC